MENKNNNRKGLKSNTNDVFYPVADNKQNMPAWYGSMFEHIKNLVATERKHVMWKANMMMTMMYYHIGKTILQQKEREGWGTRVIDRLSADLRTEYPEMKGQLPTN